jgi:uncharacterized membrane protein
MQGVVELLKGWQLHPVVDHFTVALVLVGILVDLVASLMPLRLWLRYMAVTLMVLGALAAFGSNVTGGWEAERVWEHVSGPAKDLLKTHAELGDILPYVFGALALWRIGVQFIGFLSRTRFIYLLAAIAAGGAILYQGDMGGDLVYEYGVGTAPMTAETPTPAASPTVIEQQPGALPTVYAPPATPTPAGQVPTAAPSPSPTATISSGIPLNPPAGLAAPTNEPAPPAAKSTTL